MYHRLKDLRNDKNISQADFAKLMNLQTTVYARYERGERELPLNLAITFAKFYNVSLDYLAGLIDEPRKLK